MNEGRDGTVVLALGIWAAVGTSGCRGHLHCTGVHEPMDIEVAELSHIASVRLFFLGFSVSLINNVFDF